MNELVKNSIDSRKNAIYNGYNITEQRMIEKIEDLFKRINEFGESCIDSMDFESKFASSALNQEYIKLFTEIATNCQQIVRQSEENRHIRSDAEYAAEEIASEVRYQARNITEPIRRQARQEAYDTARDMPIVGDIMQAKQIADVFGGFKRMIGKNKKKNKEDNKKEE